MSDGNAPAKRMTRAEAGRKGGKSTSAGREFRPHGVNASTGYMSNELYAQTHEDDLTLHGLGAVTTQYGGGDEDDEARLKHYASKGLRTIRTPGVGRPEAINAYFNSARDECEREWVPDCGDMLRYIEAQVGPFRHGLDWTGTEGFSERAIVKRAIRGQERRTYPEEKYGGGQTHRAGKARRGANGRRRRRRSLHRHYPQDDPRGQTQAGPEGRVDGLREDRIDLPAGAAAAREE